jgi:3-deoxy-manno-octulosonate cytidylyltransferase (CMP-KDO synthetase)
MIEHVYTRTATCSALDEVVVATCDEEIAAAARALGARVAMTSPAHERASDRVAEVLSGDPADLVVMVQGDEPMVQPGMIAAAAGALHSDTTVGCANLMAEIESDAELRDPNTIKVVTDRGSRALFLSRMPIPNPGAAPFAPGRWWKQVCIIAFRRAALLEFAALPSGPLERAESIDVLRFLEHGRPLLMVPTSVRTHAVDTLEDLARVEGLMAREALAR